MSVVQDTAELVKKILCDSEKISFSVFADRPGLSDDAKKIAAIRTQGIVSIMAMDSSKKDARATGRFVTEYAIVVARPRALQNKEHPEDVGEKISTLLDGYRLPKSHVDEMWSVSDSKTTEEAMEDANGNVVQMLVHRLTVQIINQLPTL